MGFSGRLRRKREDQKGAPMVLRVRDPRPTLTTEDTHDFLAAVKSKLAAGEPEMYGEFVDVMRAFKYRSMDTAGVVACMEVLLAGHPELLRDFNKFLPWDYIRSHGPAGGSGI